ncbi:AP-1 complex subunit sigma-3 isoform X2 [Pogoniulus pusillus]|uniref:AP-1 complex subunit sigma-3 isoform X2 n=1 Tax=Pogoniulus pusillus TaxID=488313 RepID=UPI0030B94937
MPSHRFSRLWPRRCAPAPRPPTAAPCRGAAGRRRRPGSALSGHCGKERCGRASPAAGRGGGQGSRGGRRPAGSRARPAPSPPPTVAPCRQGKLRLQKWYTTLPDKEKKKIIREIVQLVLSRNQKTSSFVDWKDLKLVYKRYASLYFCCAIEDQDNELLTLEVVHRYVELLDRYFGNTVEEYMNKPAF